MKLKHYYSIYMANISDQQDVLLAVAFDSIISKVLRLCGKRLENIQVQLNHQTPIFSLQGILPAEYSDVIRILHCLNLKDGDYFKYYVLDKLTNGLYIDLLLSCIYGCVKSNLDFVFDFNITNFTETKPQPTVTVEYKYGYDSDIVVSSIVYSNPFNGEMEMEDFLSMVVADPFYLLNSDLNAKYLLEKILCGVSCIPYSQSKYMNIVPLPQPDKSNTQVYRFWDTFDVTYGNMLGKPIMKLVDNTSATYIGHSTAPQNVITLLDTLKIQF